MTNDAMLELTSKVDWQMGKRDFRFFFEDICGFQLANFHKEWYESAQKVGHEPPEDFYRAPEEADQEGAPSHPKPLVVVQHLEPRKELFRS